MSNEIDSILSEEENALKNFLLDIDCLNPLSEWTSKFNLFDILKISRTEIRHSNMLAWLLDPNENHGLGDRIIRGFIQFLVSEYQPTIDIFNTLLMDCYDFTILREWQNIDLLAISNDNKFLICIENKIDTSEHDNQLDRYKKIVDKNYDDYTKFFVYLTPDGDYSSLPELWYSMSYQEVLKIVDKAMKETKVLSEPEMLINNYLDSLRRNIVGDYNLRKICNDIYAKHKKALDLIFENLPDKASELADIIYEWAKEKTEEGVLEFVPEKSANKYIRFKTKGMSFLMPDAINHTSGWGTSNYYFYEIINDIGERIRIQFALSSRDIPDNLRKICDKINEIYPAKMKKVNWQWRIPFSTDFYRIRDKNSNDEYDKDIIYRELDKMLEKVKDFEIKLKDYLLKSTK